MMSSRQWLFLCSCIALVTSAFTFVIRGDVFQAIAQEFTLTQAELSTVGLSVFFGMGASMFLGGFVCDRLGIRRVMFLAFACHLFGSLAFIGTPYFWGTSTTDSDLPLVWLQMTSFLMGCGNGFTEVGINPLVASMFPQKKTHYLNVLHAWWPGGLIIGGLLATGLTGVFPGGTGGSLFGLSLWQSAYLLITLPTLVYGAMLLSAQFPETERVASGVSDKDMLMEVLRPLFVVWAVCMLLTASTELGTQQWLESTLTSTAGVSGTLILVYTSGMMFVLRHFAGPIAHRISPVGLLLGSAVLSAVGLFLLSTANSALTAFLYATIFGLGVAYFWPTMLGVTAERFPKSGALGLSLMGSAGNLGIAASIFFIGSWADSYQASYVRTNHPAMESLLVNKDANALNSEVVTPLLEPQDMTEGKLPPALAALQNDPQALEQAQQVARQAKASGFAQAFATASLMPALLVFMFGGILVYDLSRGGYKPEVLLSREEQDELYSGGVEAAVE